MSGLEARIDLRRTDGFRVELEMVIPPGETAAMLGPNGAGKSTALQALAGLLAIDRGRISLGDEVLDDPGSGRFVPPESRNIGIVFQDRVLFEHLDVMENVAFGPRSRGVSRDEAVDRAGEWLHRLGIEALARRRPRTLSGGEAQRVALARALAVEPALLLLDEPLSSLDVAARVDLRDSLADHLASFGGPRLLITHDPVEAFMLADQIHVMERGAITQTGTADEIRLSPRTPYAADLAGVNFKRGVAFDGVVQVGGFELQVAERNVRGAVLLTIHPAAVSVHAHSPGGSPRNAWATTVERVEPHGNRVRLRTGEPLPLTAEITEASRQELGVEPGARIWLAVKATEIRIEGDHRPS
ncbi:MAG TPA: ABC transporter ATP-binding protein [Acidimicrobiia bacterium]|nr:ABC transporter ATP-binding protein [Acidimicrobiia bacterium]